MTRTTEWLRRHQQLHDRQINCFKYAGLWAVDPNLPLLLRQAYFVYNKFILSTMFVFAITLFADICANIDDLSIVTDGGCVLAGMCVVLFKTMNFQFRREKIASLIEETLKCGEELCQVSNADIQHILDHFLLRSSVCYYGFSVLGLVLVIALISFAPEGSLPIRAKYPVDISKTPWHELAFAVETFAVTAGMTAIVSIDSLIVTLCNDMIMTSEALNLNFENCKDKNKDFVSRFKKYLRIHQKLIAILAEHNRIFCSSMFVQMLSSTTMICLTGFQTIVVRGQSANVLKFGIYLIAAVSQLLHICWVGNELIYSCAQIDRCQWLSDWDSKSLGSVAMLMILATMFSRQPFRVKAGGFYTVSLDTFVAIMRGSYSAFTLLHKLHTESDR